MADFNEQSKAYDPSHVEDQIYRDWEASGVFNPDHLPGDRTESYAVVMPPPNVTGVLHLGHALENALMDTMVRFQRMRGKKAFIIPGTDHAALPTQAKVEKLLMQQGMTNPRKELGREKLLEKIRAFAEDSQSTILSQVKKMGTSCDWSRLAFTFDEPRGHAVFEMFRRMYEDGLIYRGSRVVNWSVKGQSTCSDDEVIYIERPAMLYTFKYASDFPIAISSTRPETKLGDTAVAVHPDDARYQAYIGKTYQVDVGAREPLQIKIITDEGVDPNFGTGALGVTPAHSPIDFEMYEKQKANGDPIGLIPVIGPDGKMMESAGAYQGLDVEVARAKFVAWLKEKNLLEKEEEIVQSVGTSDRFGDVIEAIPMTQWWLDMNKTIPGRGKSLKDLMREAVTTGLDGDVSERVAITPDRFQKLYLNRVLHLRDWCLSRQIWWGHRIPVWYRVGDHNSPSPLLSQEGGLSDIPLKRRSINSRSELVEEGNKGVMGVQEMVVSETSPGSGWEQDPDTLDTWFSSGMWTMSTLGWPNETNDLKTFHPTAWIQMGYEILYLWLMRMILMSAYVRDEVPFRDAYIHGMLRDESGKKFSKSAGNNIDPIEVIEKYGCDALRWSVLIGTTPGNDSRFYWEKVEGARNLVNKLWNIGRFVISVIPSNAEGTLSESESDSSTSLRSARNDIHPKSLADEWILSRLAEVTESVTKKIETYEFSSAGEELRDFTWGDFADWYLEIAKIEKGKEVILSHVLRTLLILWHPLMPFVTEHLWKIAGFEGQLIVSEWPTPNSPLRLRSGQTFIIQHSPFSFEFLRTLVTDMRRMRSEQGIEPVKMIEYTIDASPEIKTMLEENMEIVKTLTRASTVTLGSIPDGWIKTVSGSSTVGLDLLGSIDIAKEQEKVKKEINATQAYIDAQEMKLANAEFISKAPSQVVDGMRQKLAEAKQRITVLLERSEDLKKHSE